MNLWFSQLLFSFVVKYNKNEWATDLKKLMLYKTVMGTIFWRDWCSARLLWALYSEETDALQDSYEYHILNRLVIYKAVLWHCDLKTGVLQSCIMATMIWRDCWCSARLCYGYCFYKVLNYGLMKNWVQERKLNQIYLNVWWT